MGVETVLSIKGLTKQYKNIRAVNNLTLEVEKGSVFGLLGPNGSGKTTTLGIILSVIRATSGTFSWFNKGSSVKERRGVGAILEGPHFYHNMTAYQNLKVVAKIKGISVDNIDKVLKKVELYDRKNHKFKTFSLGMKQRLGIASALLGDPDVLILDEPTNGLDPQGIADIRELIKEIGQSGKTIILASHLLDEVQKVCDKFAILKDGELIYKGDVTSGLSENLTIEIGSLDLEKLEKDIKDFDNFISLEKKGDLFVANFDKTVDKNLLAQYLFDRSTILNHFIVTEKTLEEKFLDILEGR